MNDIQVKIGHSLLKNLVKLRQEKGELSIEDVGGLFMEMAANFSPASSDADQFMHQEIARLAKYIIDAKAEIFAISTNDKHEQVITDASQHLDEVIKATELATTKIMDAADKIQSLATGIGGDRGKEIVNVTGEIYEACNFQDITGQRITRVIKLLTGIEERINKLNELFGGTHTQQSDTNIQEKSDKDLLNGPQLPGQGATQEEIDALLVSLNPKN
jgi:chemotaxis protein CheZ